MSRGLGDVYTRQAFVQAQKSPMEYVVALGVHFVVPPGEIQKQIVKNSLQEFTVCRPLLLRVDFVNPPGRPGMHRWIDVTKFPFIGRQ